MLSSLSKAPATPPLKSQKHHVKTTTPLSTPKVRQSGKNLLPFRNQTPTIVAFNNDPSIQLTSYRKFNEENNENKTSDNNPADTTLHPYQSDSDITNSSRLQKHPSRYSLPDVPSQRVNSNSSSNNELPQFLCPTPEKPDEQEKLVAASTFVDSSMKSKVLQASFRGKAGTMDRRTTPIRPTTNRNSVKRNLPTQPKYFTTKSNEITVDGPRNCSLDSVLNLTLQLEQTATADYHRRHTISPDDVDPLLLNGLTDEENQRNQMEHDEPDRIQNSSTAANHQTIEYIVYKEKIKQLIATKYPLNLFFYSDFSSIVSSNPYFSHEVIPFDSNGTHLVICVHGLDGNSGDLRLVKTYLELVLPSVRFDFLMSSANHSSTFDDIDIMVKQLIDEIESHIDRYGLKPERISFVGHSLGNLVVRATVSHLRFEKYHSKLYTYLSLSGPHLGTLFNSSGLVNMGMWLMQKWKKSCSLAQMSLKDHVDPKQTYIYKLSQKPCKFK